MTTRQFAKAVAIPEATPAQAKARAVSMVVMDKRGRTGIVVPTSPTSIALIKHDTPELNHPAFTLETIDSGSFKQTYTPLRDYPVDRAASLFAAYVAFQKATPDAIRALRLLVDVPDHRVRDAIIREPSPTKERAPRRSTGGRRKVTRKKRGRR